MAGFPEIPSSAIIPICTDDGRKWLAKIFWFTIWVTI